MQMALINPVLIVLVDAHGEQWHLDVRDVDPARLRELPSDIQTLTGKRYWEVHPAPPADPSKGG